MKTRNAWLALVVLLAVHGAARGDFVVTATLTGDGEDPTSPGIGSAIATFISATDSLDVSIAFANLSSPTVLVDSLGSGHFHFGDPGATLRRDESPAASRIVRSELQGWVSLMLPWPVPWHLRITHRARALRDTILATSRDVANRRNLPIFQGG